MVKFPSYIQVNSPLEFSRLVCALERATRVSFLHEHKGKKVLSVQMDLPQPIGDSLAELLLQREHLSSTGIGNGIAIPHCKTPLGKQINKSMVGTFFLENSLDFLAPDGLPVFVVFVLLSVDSFHHLQLISQLARILSQSQMIDFLNNSPSLDNLVEQFQKTLAEKA